MRAAMSSVMYDLCIVGAGLVGSAAARHASSLPETTVCVIGPTEPEHLKINTGKEVFGAHYDETRITRLVLTDQVWATLTKKSIDRYRMLEKESGISFYEDVGCLTVGLENGKLLTNARKIVKDNSIEIEQMNSSNLKDKFPFLEFSDDDVAIYENKIAGHINPGEYLKAQLKIASSQGCEIYRDTVSDVTKENGQSECHMVIKTENDRTITARKVLLTTGAFTAFKNLVGPDCVPDMWIRPLTIAKVEISDEDAAKLIASRMPPILYSGKGGENWWQDFPRTAENNYGLYIFPPVKYPDGKTYLKLGHNHKCTSQNLNTLSEVQQWFCQSGNSKLVQDTAKLMGSIIKGVKHLSIRGDYCVIQETPTHRPYIDKIHSQLGVSIGGNGHGAKASDELGRIAATMMLKDEWDSEIPRETFKLKFRDSKL